MDWYSFFPWFALIPIIGVLGWAIIRIMEARRPVRDTELAEAIKQNAEINKALLEKLEGIDTRLGAVEKTLNDIP